MDRLSDNSGVDRWEPSDLTAPGLDTERGASLLPENNNIYSACFACLMQPDPFSKADMVVALFKGLHTFERNCPSEAPRRIETPGIPETPRLVDPRQVSKRGFGSDAGRLSLLHALAHIEFNAINLALDAAYRFRDMPEQFAENWLLVAAEESIHFLLVAERLRQLDTRYGAFDAHAGLWNMALKTDHDVMVRMALVPRVLEARGLDVAPPMIEKFRQREDHISADILQRIFNDEIRHVQIGNHWFRYCCDGRSLKPSDVFAQLLRQHSRGYLRGPYNAEARVQAGFSLDELDALREIEAEWSD